MAEDSVKTAEEGVALYTRPVLRLYDLMMLGFNCRFMWECPSRHMLALYNECVSANHLDIGVGTGYFMDNCKFPSENPRLALMDYSPNSLHAASGRLARYRPETYHRNVMEPLGIDAPKFDSVGMMNLIHCLPGNMQAKGIVFDNVKALMNPGAVIFGSTILFEGVKVNPLAVWAIKGNNSRGIMGNLHDNPADLEKELKQRFSDVSMQIIGCEALFRAKS